MQNARSLARIAHLSDVHMLAERPAPARSLLDVGTRFASFGRALDTRARTRKLALGLRAARESGAGHFVISGDLTELGTTEQFETFAEVLWEARIDPDAVTLVPGNHDAYTRADAWSRALAGPLAAYRRSSALPAAAGACRVVETAGAIFLPLDVACHQHFTRAAGELTPDAAHAVDRRVAGMTGRGRPIIIVSHTPRCPTHRGPGSGFTGCAVERASSTSSHAISMFMSSMGTSTTRSMCRIAAVARASSARRRSSRTRARRRACVFTKSRGRICSRPRSGVTSRALRSETLPGDGCSAARHCRVPLWPHPASCGQRRRRGRAVLSGTRDGESTSVSRIDPRRAAATGTRRTWGGRARPNPCTINEPYRLRRARSRGTFPSRDERAAGDAV